MRALQKEARQRERAVVGNVLRKAQIVLCTCVGAGSKILKDCEFDMVVIDEAAQGLEAACWVPIMKLNTERNGGGKVVLAGRLLAVVSQQPFEWFEMLSFDKGVHLYVCALLHR